MALGVIKNWTQIPALKEVIVQLGRERFWPSKVHFEKVECGSQANRPGQGLQPGVGGWRRSFLSVRIRECWISGNRQSFALGCAEELTGAECQGWMARCVHHGGRAPSCMERKCLGLEGLPMSGMSKSWVLYLEDGGGYLEILR